jgi:hypothetical protein
MDPGRSLSPRSRTGSRSSPKLGPVSSPPRAAMRKRLGEGTPGSPYRTLGIDTGPPAGNNRRRADSGPGTPFPSERFTHVTYTTYCKGTTYTNYVIREAAGPAMFQLDRPRGLILQTTYKTLKQNTEGENTWFTQIHSWMTCDPMDGGPTVPSSPRRRLRSIAGLERGQLSPRRFSGVGNF